MTDITAVGKSQQFSRLIHSAHLVPTRSSPYLFSQVNVCLLSSAFNVGPASSAPRVLILFSSRDPRGPRRAGDPSGPGPVDVLVVLVVLRAGLAVLVKLRARAGRQAGGRRRAGGSWRCGAGRRAGGSWRAGPGRSTSRCLSMSWRPWSSRGPGWSASWRPSTSREPGRSTCWWSWSCCGPGRSTSRRPVHGSADDLLSRSPRTPIRGHASNSRPYRPRFRHLPVWILEALSAAPRATQGHARLVRVLAASPRVTLRIWTSQR